MAFLSSFAAYVPPRIVSNADLADGLNCTPDWIVEVSGIEERRYAADDQTVVDMAVEAAKGCLKHASGNVGMIIVSSGSSDLQFPGPASQVADRLCLGQIPALDIPMASAGALFAIALASQLTTTYGNILIVATDKMSAIAMPSASASKLRKTRCANTGNNMAAISSRVTASLPCIKARAFEASTKA